MAKKVDKRFWNSYFKAYNSRDYERVVNEFYTKDVVFENPKQKFVGGAKVLKHFENAHKGVTENLKPLCHLITPKITAVQLAGTITAEKDMPKYYVAPLKKGKPLKIGMAAFYHMRGDKIKHIYVYWA